MKNLREDIWAQPEEMIRSAEHLVTVQVGALEKAAELLQSRPGIVLTGMGSSFFISLAAQYCAQRMGLRTLAVDTGELCHDMRSWLQDATLVIVSRSGESAEIVRLLATAREAHCPIIAITNAPDSSLGRAADLILDVHADFDHNVSVKMYNGPLQTAILVLVRAAGGDPGTLLEPLRRGWTQVAERLEGWEQALEEVAPLFRGAVTQYYLGRGVGYASACEGRLLCEEASKYPATADNAGAFRHGSIEVVNEAFRGVLFLTPGTPMTLTASLAAAIEGFGGKSLVLAPDGAAVPQVTLSLRFPDVDPVLAPLFEITPAQLLALKLAEWRGADCNSFQRCSYVIREEQ